MTKKAFIFPGQGSQFVGMGKDFFDSREWAKEIFNATDRVAGKPISKLCFEGPLEELTQTANLQPAVTAVNLVCYRALMDSGLAPEATAGHSVGEFSALAAAGVIEFEDALRLVDLRGRLMQRDAEARPGAMQAVIGLDIGDVEAVVELAGDRGEVVVANHNSPTQVVITGESEAVAAAAKFIQTKGGKTIPLPVSGAWHSPLMANAGEDFKKEIEKTDFKAAAIPVYLNVTGRAETDPAAIKEAMTRQIVSPVKWCDIVLNMINDGVSNFVEVGPKKVLSGLVKKTAPSGSGINLINVQSESGVTIAAEKLGG